MKLNKLILSAFIAANTYIANAQWDKKEHVIDKIRSESVNIDMNGDGYEDVLRIDSNHRESPPIQYIMYAEATSDSTYAKPRTIGRIFPTTYRKAIIKSADTIDNHMDLIMDAKYENGISKKYILRYEDGKFRFPKLIGTTDKYDNYTKINNSSTPQLAKV